MCHIAAVLSIHTDGVPGRRRRCNAPTLIIGHLSATSCHVIDVDPITAEDGPASDVSGAETPRYQVNVEH